MKKKRILWLLMALIALVGFNGLAFADSMEFSANTSKVEKPYIPPAWSQILEASKRFVLVMNNEAVLDKETGLVWEKSPDTKTRTWVDAIAYAYDKTVGGRDGWRLPTEEELKSLVDRTQSNPALPKGHPFINVQSDFYWSSTTDVSNASYAWGVFFDVGRVGYYDKARSDYVWCVRGGQGYNAQ